MKTLPLRAQVQWMFLAVLVIVGFIGGLSAAYAAGAQLQLPSSQTRGYFHPWKKMHPSTFDLSMDSVWEQCTRTEPTEPWLTPKHCTLLTEKLEAKQCKVVMVPDGIKLDRLLGRVSGGTGDSRPWARQEKRTGRLDRAMLCDLGDGVHSYWFTGDKGKSCNNVSFVYLPPSSKPQLAVTPSPVPALPPVVKRLESTPKLSPVPTQTPVPQGQWVCVMVPVGVAVQSAVEHQLEGFVLRNDCCCDDTLVVPSHNFHLGSTLQSAGYAEQCFFQP
jgi:hypothetical protein